MGSRLALLEGCVVTDVVNHGRFCAQWFMLFYVQGTAKDPYVVFFERGQGPHCTCLAFEHSREKIKTCKHVVRVMTHACLWNELWYSGGDRTLQPVPRTCRVRTANGYECPQCGGPVVIVPSAA